MRLSALLTGLSDVRVLGDPEDRDIVCLTDDSRRVTGDSTIFYARRGHTRDGAAFIPDAVRRGCRVILAEREVLLPSDCAQILCKFAIKTSAEIALRCFGHPEKRLRFVGITGTKGKTTTAFFLTRLLRLAGERTASVGTLGADLGVDIFETENTTPSVFALAPILSECVRRGIHTVVTEVSSQALADGRVYGLPFSLGIFTSFSPDHIGSTEHRDLAEYAAAKRSLFSSYGIHTAVANGDDPYAAYMVSDTPERFFCSLSRAADYEAHILSSDLSGTRFSFREKVGKISMPGAYNLGNVLLALVATEVLTGRRAEEFLPFLPGISVPGRFERYEYGGRFFLIDFAHNEDSVRKLTEAVSALYAGRRIAVFGSVGGRGEARRASLAKAAEESVDFSVITADDPEEEDPLGICVGIYNAFSDKTKAKIVVDREEAIRYAYRISKPGDVILLLGKGHETVQKTADGARPFSEKNIVFSLDNPSRVC